MEPLDNITNNENNLRQKTLFRENFNRYKSIKASADGRALFEALYNCFENASKYSLSIELWQRYIPELKNSNENNHVRFAFIGLYNNQKSKTFLKNIKKLRSYEPIANNSTKHSFRITKAQPFETFLDVLYTVRNNVRHGQKEDSERSDKIISVLVNILDEYVESLHKLIYPELILFEKAESQRTARNSILLEDASDIISNPVFLFILFWIGVLFYTIYNGPPSEESANCSKNPEICEYEERYDWARPY